jgi:hypothetical protein
VVVDQEDYQWAIQWKWHFNKPHPTRKGSKQYLVRSNGSGGRRRGKKFIFHVEIMKRKGTPPTTEQHIYVAHLDDNEFNCKRSNLEWATPSQNRIMSERSKNAKPKQMVRVPKRHKRSARSHVQAEGN